MGTMNIGGGVVDSAMLGSFVQVGSYIHDATISSATELEPPATATAVILQASTQDIYVTLDDSTPSATNGMLIIADAGAVIFPLQGSNPVKVLEAAATAVLRGVWVK